MCLRGCDSSGQSPHAHHRKPFCRSGKKCEDPPRALPAACLRSNELLLPDKLKNSFFHFFEWQYQEVDSRKIVPMEAALSLPGESPFSKSLPVFSSPAFQPTGRPDERQWKAFESTFAGGGIY